MYDIGEVDGRPFLSMEYVDGEDLASLLRRIGHLPEEKGIEVARQLAAGLAAAHEEGIVHRDLKPANVMIDESGQVRIMDFGLAGVIGEIQDLRSGTPAHQAPEQMRGEDVSARTDLYSLGLSLYEVFTGRRAFEEPSAPRELSAASVVVASDRGRDGTGGVAMPRAAPRGSTCLRARARGNASRRRPHRRSARGGKDAVARARGRGRRPACLPGDEGFCLRGAIALGLVLFVALRATRLLLAEVPAFKPPAVLVDRAETLAAKLGLGSFPHTGFGFRTSRAPLLVSGQPDTPRDARPQRSREREGSVHV